MSDEEESTVIDEPKKMLIIDCRSYGAAFANRAKGGGVECPGMLYCKLSSVVKQSGLPTTTCQLDT